MSTFHSKSPWHVHHVTAVVEETVAEGHQSILEQIPDCITEGLNQILSLTLQLNSCCQRNSKLHSRSDRKSSKNEILLSTFIPNVPLTHTHRVGLQPKPPSSDRSYHDNGRQGCVCAFFKSGGVCLGGGLRLCAPWGEGSSQGCRLNKHAGSERARIECFSLELSGGREEESFYFSTLQTSNFSCAYIHPENTWRLKSDICNNRMCL